MSLSCVQPEEVREIIAYLSNSATFGFHEIDTYILKLIKDEINPSNHSHCKPVHKAWCISKQMERQQSYTNIQGMIY